MPLTDPIRSNGYLKTPDFCLLPPLFRLTEVGLFPLPSEIFYSHRMLNFLNHLNICIPQSLIIGISIIIFIIIIIIIMTKIGFVILLASSLLKHIHGVEKKCQYCERTFETLSKHI